MKILELIEDRKGKLSAIKLSFLAGAFIFLIGWLYVCIKDAKVEEMPNSLALFLGVLGANQLGQTYLKNKAPVDPAVAPVLPIIPPVVPPAS